MLRMELLQSSRFLFAAIFSAAFIHVALLQDCDDDCYDEICNAQSGSQCVFVDGNVTCSADPSCVVTNSIADCQSNDNRRLLSLDSTSPGDAERCLDYVARLNRTSGTGTPLSSGVYIIESFRFCTNQSIGKILLRINSPSSATSVEEFHIYKQYRDDGDRAEWFVRSTSFNVTLSYSDELNVLVAVPMTPTRADQGDYLGLTLPEGIEILTTVASSTDGVYSVSSPIGQCHGSSLDVFEIDTNNIITGDPLISVEEERRTTTAPPDITPPPPDLTMSTTNAPPISTTTPEPTNTPGPTTLLPGVDTSNPITLIVGAAVGGGVAIAILVALVIITLLCLYFTTSRKGHAHIGSYSSEQTFEDPSIGDRISMNTYNSQYMDTHNFRPPANLRPRGSQVETVENPISEDDHDYNMPFEMNAAQARTLPSLPLSTTVTNVHYAAPGPGLMGQGSVPEPHYQDPDELASTPMIEKKRKTFKNPLYSTTAEFLQQDVTNGGAVPIYDQPVELQNGGTPQGVSHPRSLGENGINIYRDEEPGSVNTMAYSMPINGHQYHVLEQNSEVMPSTGHHYHLLDDNKNRRDSDTDSNRSSLLKSNVHHIVNEPGAYVPNAEERKELFSDNNLSVDKFEAWKKSSYKTNKFFVKAEEFWVPSKDDEILYDQLSQKKFREIVKDQLIFQSHLGQGQFGSVQKAKWTYNGGSKSVAVKIMKPSALENTKVKFLQEAAILGQFFHSNVIKLFGVVTLNNPVMIVMEYMQNGDLLSYMHEHYKPSEAPPPKPNTLLSFCRQIACGMKYLSRKHFVHRDLAARNIFISETLVCKIGDFGMSRNLLDEEYYICHGGVVPIKWTAPEGLNYKKYTTASDVYSYGMTMYEIWSLGEKPLRDIPQEQVALVTLKGYCQPPPPGTPRKMYHLMVQSWDPKHSRRPTFDDLFEMLNGCDDDLLGWSDEDLAKMSSPRSRQLGSPLEDGECLYKDLQTVHHGVTPDML